LVYQHLPELACSVEDVEREIAQPLLMKWLRVYTHFQPDTWLAEYILQTGMDGPLFGYFLDGHTALYRMSAGGRLAGRGLQRAAALKMARRTACLSPVKGDCPGTKTSFLIVLRSTNYAEASEISELSKVINFDFSGTWLFDRWMLERRSSEELSGAQVIVIFQLFHLRNRR
jgi:hypothetical protein